jgi:hypothetical protein
MSRTRYSSQILMKIEFYRQIFDEYSNIVLHENSFSVSRVVPCGRTDRHDEANCRFSQFCKMRLITVGRHWFVLPLRQSSKGNAMGFGGQTS